MRSWTLNITQKFKVIDIHTNPNCYPHPLFGLLVLEDKRGGVDNNLGGVEITHQI